jgi:hypothetical protein
MLRYHAHQVLLERLRSPRLLGMDTDLHVGNEPCQTVKPVVVDAVRKEVTTGLNFLVSRQASKLSFTTAGRRQKGSNKAGSLTLAQDCVSSCILFLVDVGCDCND